MDLFSQTVWQITKGFFKVHLCHICMNISFQSISHLKKGVIYMLTAQDMPNVQFHSTSHAVDTEYASLKCTVQIGEAGHQHDLINPNAHFILTRFFNLCCFLLSSAWKPGKSRGHKCSQDSTALGSSQRRRQPLPCRADRLIKTKSRHNKYKQWKWGSRGNNTLQI